MQYIIESIFLMLILFGDDIKSTNAQTGASVDACQTPNQETGACIPIHECEDLNKLLEKGTITTEERTLLQSSQCGYRDGKYLVCCPLDINDRYSAGTNTLPELPNCPYQLKPNTLPDHAAAIDEAPWLALIEYTKLDTTTGFYCGGALINNRYILTAAHCFKGRLPENWKPTGVRLGEWHLKRNPDCQFSESGKKSCAPGHTNIPIETVKLHPHYVPSLPTQRNQHHDIALVRLAQPVEISDFIRPICLPQLGDLQENLFEGQMLSVAGWGITRTGTNSIAKLTTNLTLTVRNECGRKYIEQRIALIQGQLCADGLAGDTCIVDSGGPLVYTHVVDNRAYYFMVGINSIAATTCGQPGWPDLYTRVGQYLEWIRRNVTP